MGSVHYLSLDAEERFLICLALAIKVKEVEETVARVKQEHPRAKFLPILEDEIKTMKLLEERLK